MDSEVMKKEIEKCIIKGQNNQVRSLEFQNFKQKFCSLSLIDILSNLLQKVVRNFHELKKTTPLFYLCVLGSIKIHMINHSWFMKPTRKSNNSIQTSIW